MKNELFEKCLANVPDYDRGYTAGAMDIIDKAKEAFSKACGWLHVYPWYEEVEEEFVKAMEDLI